MRTVTYGAACSLDGFITGPDGAVDWLQWSDDVNAIMAAYWATIDTLLMGRKTWDAFAAAPANHGAAMTGITSYVFSRTLERIDRPNVVLVRESAGEFVRELKGKSGRDICLFGGSDFARSLFAAGVVDEIGLNVHPVLLGRGTPLFHDPGRRIHVEPKECRRIAGGCVYATYRVAP